jgi:hypothetical protein
MHICDLSFLLETSINWYQYPCSCPFRHFQKITCMQMWQLIISQMNWYWWDLKYRQLPFFHKVLITLCPGQDKMFLSITLHEVYQLHTNALWGFPPFSTIQAGWKNGVKQTPNREKKLDNLRSSKKKFKLRNFHCKYTCICILTQW